MSDLVNTKSNADNLHRHLMATASALALVASACGIENALARDSDTPTVWIELGGQLERIESSQPSFSPPFIQNAPDTTAPVSPAAAQRPPQYANGAEGKLSFEPAGTDLLFSAGIRYGRSNGGKHIHQQTRLHSNFFGQYPYAFTDVRAKDEESHMVLDFRAGKDLGLGMFGQHGRSALSLGVRYAQFSSRADVRISNNPTSNPYNFHHFYQTGHVNRSFIGIGPSLAWDGSAAILGSEDTSLLAFDWGADFALLFGRQKSDVHHNTHLIRPFYGVLYSNTLDRTPSKSVVVPNPGGFAGLSVRYANAKVTFGYRADFFLGAVDGGLDTRKSDSLNFYGPFAAIGIGL